uniref:Uncharacterized protein n=1 Tax=Arundo donax TaxID=35708 RepID=A0A0A8XWL6_ARUDO
MQCDKWVTYILKIFSKEKPVLLFKKKGCWPWVSITISASSQVLSWPISG